MTDRTSIQAAFTPVGPLSTEVNHKVNIINRAFLDLALEVESTVPASADRTSAIRRILNAKFECVQALTHQKLPQPASASQKTVTDSKTDINALVATRKAEQKGQQDDEKN